MTLQAAYELAFLGFSVFPVWGISNGECACGDPQCASPGKHPWVRWRDAATRDAAVIAELWRPGASIGVATGLPSGVVVIDLDGEKGIRQWDRLCAGRGGHPRTLESVTGGGGRHLYFARPADCTIRNSVRRLGPGIDVRSDGGYVLAPPSAHRSGNAYRWAKGRGPRDESPAELPWWLEMDLNAPQRDRQQSEPARPGETTRYGAAALRRICEELANTGRGGRNNALNRAAFAVAQLVAGGQIADLEGRRAVAEAAAKSGLGAKEIRQTARSAWRAGMREPFAPRKRAA